jgi:threonine dehydrogenase-like Zn-dependent dehydrogenase
VALPETLDFATAASLGCRFVTSFRAVVDQGKTSAGQLVAVYGCGGVGLSAIMIANAVGANVLAIDIAEDKLDLARSLGAVATVNAAKVANVAEAVIEITPGGAHVSLDALGHPTTCFNSINKLRKRGKHIQVGLMLADHSTPAVPMSKVIAHELELLGSHGMQAHRYDAMHRHDAIRQAGPRKAHWQNDQSGAIDRGADEHGQIRSRRCDGSDGVLKALKLQQHEACVAAQVSGGNRNLSPPGTRNITSLPTPAQSCAYSPSS